MLDKTCFLSVGGVSITGIPSGSLIAGESYTLVCSTGGSEAERFQWLGPPDGMTLVVESSPRLNITSSATTSQLQFTPVGQSDDGSYSCNATVGDITLSSEPVMIDVTGIIISHFHCTTM